MPTASQVEGSMFHELIVSLMNLTEPSQKAKLAPPGCMLEAASTGMFQQPAATSDPNLRWALTGNSASNMAKGHQFESHQHPVYSLAAMSEGVKIACDRSAKRKVLLVPSVIIAILLASRALI